MYLTLQLEERVIRIVPYSEDLVQAVRDFNQRLESSGTREVLRLPETAQPSMLARSQSDTERTADSRPDFFQECFVALDNQVVRGGYILYRQSWSLAGQSVAVANAMRNISEGVINPGLGLVGIKMIQDALLREPLQFGLGLGGPSSATTRLLRVLRWDVWPVPFYFRITNPKRFITFLPQRSSNSCTRLLSEIVSRSRLAPALNAIAVTRPWPARNHAVAERVEYFHGWADEIWERAQRAYPVLAWRDATILNRLFGGRQELLCLKIENERGTVGWAILDRIGGAGEVFGQMQAYSIMDCLAAPQHAQAVIDASMKYLKRRGADLIISYQSHPAWRRALFRAGFFRRRSTFLFASAPALTERVVEVSPTRDGMHITRGGGDVPVFWARSISHEQATGDPVSV